jgi:hypothetical protein
MNDYSDPVQDETNEDMRREIAFEDHFGCSPAEHARREAEQEELGFQQYVRSMDEADRAVMEHAFEKDD